MDISLYLLLFVIGAIMGSFLNMLIYRIPLNISLISPGSFCDQCKTPLKWYENVPIISYLVTLGKCRYCNTRFSISYTLIEAAMGLLFIYIYNYAQNITHFIYLSFLLTLLIGICIIDIKHFIISDKLLFPAGVISILYYIYIARMGIFNYFLGAIIVFCILYGLKIGSKYVFHREAFGFGDVKLGTLLGFILGWKPALLAIFFGFVIAGFVIAILAVMKKLKRNSYIPFGPFLILGMITYLFFGKLIVLWYLHFFIVLDELIYGSIYYSNIPKIRFK